MKTLLSFFGRFLAIVAFTSLLSVAADAVTSVTYYGITWYFSADKTVGTFVNGEPWVVGPVTITNIHPNPSQSVDGTQHGSMINPIPNKHFGFDSHPLITAPYSDEVIYEAALNVALHFPFTLNQGDVLVSANSQYNYPNWIKTVCALTVLSSPPAAGSFRPSIFGTDRTVKWNVSQLNWSVLKNFTAVPSTPSKATIQAQVPPLPWFEWAKIWSGNLLQPVDNTADGGKQYGRDTAAKFGQVALWLNTNQPLADKQPIAIQIVQNGLDIYAYVQNGGGFLADGGHKCGRKLPLVIAAMMLNDTALKAMAGSTDLNIFQEDGQTFFVTQADVGRPLEDNPGHEILMYRQEDVGMAEWGIRHNWYPFEDNRSWGGAVYRTVVGPGMMGPWLAAYLMGAQSVWNHPAAFAYMERYHTIAGDGSTFTADMYTTHKLGGTITPPPSVVADPVIAPSGGTFDSPQSVSISTTTPSAAIHYTLNGATPASSDALYSGPLTVTSTGTIKAIAYATGFNPSGVTTANLTFSVAPPTFSPDSGGFIGSQTVTLSSTTSGATICFTTDGSDPSASSTVYTNPIAVTTTTTIKAIAIKSGIPTSSISTGVYSIGAFVGSQTWTSVGFATQTSSFTYGYDMSATANNIDAVVGIGGVNPVTAYADLACIVRFNTSGKIDARNGSVYSALADLPYSAGNVYSVRIIVDPVAKTYGVTVAVNGGTAVVVAQNYAFRTEQASLASFSCMAIYAYVGSQTVSHNGLITGRPSQPKGLRVLGQ